MGKNTKIQWATHTWNPWIGCRKVSEGCARCYMFRDLQRTRFNPNEVVRAKTTFNFPNTVKEPSRIFVPSLSDFFIEEADQWRDEAWEIMRDSPHTYLITTKREDRIEQCLPGDWGEGYPNVHLGVSVENERQFYKRVPVLDQVKAAVKWISFEPLLGLIDVLESGWELGIDWIVIGGESGFKTGKFKARPCDLEWIKHLICWQYAGIPVFVKQLGSHLARELVLKHAAGGDIDEWPKELRVRQFPEIEQSTPTG